MNQKGFANTVLIILVVILAGALGYVTLVKKPASVKQPQVNNSQNTQPTTPPPTNNTASQNPTVAQTQTPTQIKPGWRTFSNKEHGVSISFPNKFVAEDNVEDFQWLCSGCGGPPQNAEYFYFCDGTHMPPTGKVCSEPFSYFGINLHDYVVNQALIDSWGGEVAYSQQTTVNGKPAWVVKLCAAAGCSVSIMFNHSSGTLSVSFYNNLYIDGDSPLFISELAKEILSTLKF